jgi:large subunit ribosomal protein L29
MSIKDLIAKSPQELTEELLRLRREQFNLRMGAAAGQPAKPDQFRRVRRSIARVKTVLNQKRVQGDGR